MESKARKKKIKKGGARRANDGERSHKTEAKKLKALGVTLSKTGWKNKISLVEGVRLNKVKLYPPTNAGGRTKKWFGGPRKQKPRRSQATGLPDEGKVGTHLRVIKEGAEIEERGPKHRLESVDLTQTKNAKARKWERAAFLFGPQSGQNETPEEEAPLSRARHHLAKTITSLGTEKAGPNGTPGEGTGNPAGRSGTPPEG